MCEWGDTVDLEVTIPANLSHTGEERRAVKPIDRCIAPIVRTLNAGGVITVASCCGHGKRPGDIALEDGRELIIAADYDEARRFDILIAQAASRAVAGSATPTTGFLMAEDDVGDGVGGGDEAVAGSATSTGDDE